MPENQASYEKTKWNTLEHLRNTYLEAALFCIDLDKFKEVNEITFGHSFRWFITQRSLP